MRAPRKHNRHLPSRGCRLFFWLAGEHGLACWRNNRLDPQRPIPMPTSSLRPFDPERDLVLQRVIPVPLAKVWEAWTTPEQLKQWFCPLPWKVVACEVDLRPGGVFGTTMRGPAGEEHASEGCYLEIVPHKRLVWTDGLGPGFRPAEKAFMTGILEQIGRAHV